ncbi:MAG: hypothetical protein A2X20_06185 [Bacteroidetes bacterium GWE2_40_15]|nr:MAG: hypothetical protein A2X20_06185 [Bacteroidetes bacterium GWE2_40_15]
MENQTNELIKDDKDFKNTIEAIIKDRVIRNSVASQSHLMFFHIYFSHYVKNAIADFQKEIFRITENPTNKLACIVAFRGSAKSTLVTLSYALWSILGVQKKKFVLIISQTKPLSGQHMASLRNELENNLLLKSDLGPFHEESGGEWSASSVVFSNSGARITIASVDQCVRGLRNNEHRPDLIILDDIEDSGSVKTAEGRNKTFEWFTREILPLGDLDTRVIIVGNFLHHDSLVMRIRKKIEAGEIDGIFKSFPIVDEDGQCLWPSKFDSKEKIESLRRKVMNESAWRQEYLLIPASEETAVICPEWIKTYKDLPKWNSEGLVIGVDLAVSLEDSADYTAMVSIKIFYDNNRPFFYVLPNPINKRMKFPESAETLKKLINAHEAGGENPKVAIESNGFQGPLADILADGGGEIIKVINSSNKRTRFVIISPLFQNGTILFPEKGAEGLITQAVGFGSEDYDDQIDALINAVTYAIEKFKRFIPPQIFMI